MFPMIPSFQNTFQFVNYCQGCVPIENFRVDLFCLNKKAKLFQSATLYWDLSTSGSIAWQWNHSGVGLAREKIGRFPILVSFSTPYPPLPNDSHILCCQKTSLGKLGAVPSELQLSPLKCKWVPLTCLACNPAGARKQNPFLFFLVSWDYTWEQLHVYGPDKHLPKIFSPPEQSGRNVGAGKLNKKMSLF